MKTCRKLHLPLVVAIRSKPCFVVTILGPYDPRVFFKMKDLRVHVIAGVGSRIVSVDIYKVLVRYIAAGRGRGSDGIENLCPCLFQ